MPKSSEAVTSSFALDPLWDTERGGLDQPLLMLLG